MHVVIIGAGASGLSAAQTLLKDNRTNIKVTVVEASNVVGGRIKSDYTFLTNHLKLQQPTSSSSSKTAPLLGIELGAEFIHGGEGSILYDLVKKQENWDTEDIFITSQADGGPQSHPTLDHGMYGAYYLGAELDRKLLLYNDTSDQDLLVLNQIFRDMEDHENAADNNNHHENKHNDIFSDTVVSTKSLADYLQEHNIPSRMHSLAVAGYGNTAGCSDLSQISYAASCSYEQYWDEHEESLDVRIKDPSITMDGVIGVLMKGVGYENIKLNWPVSSVNYESEEKKIIVRSEAGEELAADKCIVSIPLLGMQKSAIEFIPSLPKVKTDAYQMLGMGSACKLLLKFKEPLWPEKLQSVVCGNSFIPEVWFRRFEIPSSDSTEYTSSSPSSVVWVAVCYFMSDAAQKVESLGLEKSTRLALDQLREMFSSFGPSMNVDESFIESKMYSWSKDEPYIGGGYSFPKVGIQPRHFASMAEPVDEKLFFCGEHTHLGAPMTVQAAMETGIRAAKEVLHEEKKNAMPVLGLESLKLVDLFKQVFPILVGCGSIAIISFFMKKKTR